MHQKTVSKRSGKNETFDAEKINKILEWAVEDLAGVQASDIAVHAELNIFDGMRSMDIHTILIDSARDLISEENPNYSKVAARLLIYKLRKIVWGGRNAPKLLALVRENTAKGFYSRDIVEDYTDDEINKFDEFIDHDRDEIFEYAGLQQFQDKYLVQDRGEKSITETPQFAYMLIAMNLYSAEDKAERTKFVKDAYDRFSKFKPNLSTPIMAGSRTPTRSYASCCLIEVDDTKGSLFSSNTATGLATCNKYGIGVNLSNLRGIDAPIKNGETLHTGVIPWLKMFEATIHSCQQGGARRGAGTVTFPMFHYQIEDILPLKNNTGTEDNRVRHLDYCISIPRFFYERFMKDESITLFSSHNAREVYDALGTKEFQEVYEKYEKKKIKFKKTVKARALFEELIKQRVETGRIYILNVDECNNSSPWINPVTYTNLCTEILHPTKPFEELDSEDGEIGVCVLSSVNMLRVESDSDHEKTCRMIVRMLDNLIDKQDYFDKAAERFCKNKRSIGVGVTNLAGWLASQGFNHCSPEAPESINEFMERQQYYLLRASCDLAKERGACKDFDQTKYSLGKMPLDMYNKNVDEFLTVSFLGEEKWNELAEDIKEYGLRHCTLSTEAPHESSSVVQASTNGMEPIRSLITFKKSKSGGVLPVLAPSIKKWKNKYIKAFDMPDNSGLIKCIAAVSKWLDMSASTNLYSPKGDINQKDVMQDILTATKYGVKTFYYHNTDDENKEEEGSGCSGGSCTL